MQKVVLLISLTLLLPGDFFNNEATVSVAHSKIVGIAMKSWTSIISLGFKYSFLRVLFLQFYFK